MSGIEHVQVAIADFEPHPRNYNEHPEPQVSEIAESLRLFGQVKPVVVWRRWFVAGHGVVLGARRLGWTHVKAERLPDDWPEHKALAYLAADNELARGASPNLQALAALAADIRAEDETLARLAAGGAEGLAELEAMAGRFDLTDAKPDLKRGLGDKKHQIKPVLYVEQVAVFEQALRATGNQNRGDALMDVCRFYLEHHGTEAGTEGQFNAALESGIAALAAVSG